MKSLDRGGVDECAQQQRRMSQFKDAQLKASAGSRDGQLFTDKVWLKMC